MCERMVAGDWNERYEAITALETFVNSRPGALSAHLVKVWKKGGEGGGAVIVKQPSHFDPFFFDQSGV